MANVRYGLAGRYMTTADLKALADKVRADVLNDIEKDNHEFFERFKEESLYINMVCFAAALIDSFGFGYHRLMRCIDRVADIMDEVNEGNVTLEELEEQLASKGITLRRRSMWEDMDLERIIEHYGTEYQKRKAAEELCEFAAEILKDVAGHGDQEHIKEEMADALIMINQLRIIYGNFHEVFDIMDAKIERTLQRIEDDDVGTA